jgi:hypothetical protein
MTDQTQPVSVSRPKRVLGVTGEVAGVVGVVVCALLIVALLLARAWTGDRIDETAASIDANLAKGVPLLEASAANVAAVSERIVGVAEAAEAVAARPNPAPALVEALSSRLAGLSESYLELRTTYADARETIVGAIDRLLLLERLIPPLTVPREPLEALAAADARVREMDARVQEILAAPGAGAVREVASAVAETARVSAGEGVDLLVVGSSIVKSPWRHDRARCGAARSAGGSGGTPRGSATPSAATLTSVVVGVDRRSTACRW